MEQQYPSKLLENAVEEFAKLPGIGRKTALRLVLHLLRQEPQVSRNSADALLTLLYEGISRAREKLCLVVIGHEELFGRILQIRQN